MANSSLLLLTLDKPTINKELDTQFKHLKDETGMNEDFMELL